jgi:hypothetical protein
MKAVACLATAAASFAAFGCSETATVRPPVAPAATIVGEPQSCVSRGQLRETRIRDDSTIDFFGSGGRVWRNTLSGSCPGLRPHNGFAYETSLSQLCSTDIIYVLETAGGLRRGAACGLGPFVPVKLAK